MKTKWILVAAGSFVVGAIFGGWWMGRAYSQLFFAKEIEVAGVAGMDALALALLRLGDTKSAIEELETRMDGAAYALAQWEEVNPMDEKTRKARDNFLTSVKFYHESYPASGNAADKVNALLARIPGRNSQKICNNGICRLDELHRAALNARKAHPDSASQPSRQESKPTSSVTGSTP